MKRINKKTPAKCAICASEFDSYIKLARHIQFTHKMKSKEYFDEFVEPFDHVCRICNKNKTKFINLKEGYFDICSQRSCIQEKISQTKEIKYGDRNYNNRPKAILTNANKSPEEEQNRRRKIAMTRNKNKNEDPQYQEKINIRTRKTKLEKYGNEKYVNVKKMSETNLERYGVKNVFQAESIKQKIKETNLKNLGVEYPKQSQKCIEKSNKTFYKHCEEDQDFLNNRTLKAKETCAVKYGNPNYRNIEQQKRHMQNVLLSKNEKPSKNAGKQILKDMVCMIFLLYVKNQLEYQNYHTE